jgi:ssDNA-binding Zn-finger/Zn-ribbon topoisomerase 1
MQATAGRQSSKLPRINAATRKPPTACPHCGCRKLVRMERRRKKLEIVELQQCAYCRGVFLPLPPPVERAPPPLQV